MKKYLKTITFASMLVASTSFLCSANTLTIDGVGEFSEVINKEEIATRVQELGKQIDYDYANVQTPIVFVGVLNGCLPFLADLMRAVTHSCVMQTLRVSSYHGSTQSSGQVEFKYDSMKGQSLEGKHVIIVDDIIDTGVTMSFIVDYLHGKNPASIKIASLILKESCQQVQTPAIDYIGFVRSPEFLIGYGLDYNEEYRNLPGIWALNQS